MPGQEPPHHLWACLWGSRGSPRPSTCLKPAGFRRLVPSLSCNHHSEPLCARGVVGLQEAPAAQPVNGRGRYEPRVAPEPGSYHCTTLPLLGQCKGTRLGPLAKTTPESCCPDCVTHTHPPPAQGSSGRFPIKESFKHWARRQEVRPCFLQTERESGYHPGQTGWVPPGFSHCRGTEPRKPTSTREGGPASRGDRRERSWHAPCTASGLLSSPWTRSPGPSHLLPPGNEGPHLETAQDRGSERALLAGHGKLRNAAMPQFPLL